YLNCQHQFISMMRSLFFFNALAPTEIYTLSLHDALPISNQGRPIDEFIFGQNFLVTALPHFTLDRYTALLRQVEVHDMSDLENVLNHMERIGWVKWLSNDEFRFLRPFHRVFGKCIELTQTAHAPSADESDSASTTEENPVNRE